jgi:hypothetical protein
MAIAVIVVGDVVKVANTHAVRLTPLSDFVQSQRRQHQFHSSVLALTVGINVVADI